MLEGLAAWVLNTYVGEYVQNLNTHQLSIALLQGAVELENLPLKKDALKSLGLPLQVNAGYIGKIKLQIPLRRLHSEPWVISIEKLYLVAGPLTDTQYDETKEKEEEVSRKEKLLKALETKQQLQKDEKQESSSWFSYGTSIAANILENVQLIIKDVHIRYEDDITNPGCPFSFGIVIKELSAQSTDGQWVPKFVHRDDAELMHKLIDLKNFALYFDTNTTLVGHMEQSDLADTLQREMYVSSVTSQFKDHEYILSPVSATAKMKRYTSALPMRKTDTPRNTIDLNLENMAFSLSEAQYRNMVLTLKEFDQFQRRKPYRKWRPSCPVRNNAKLWWKFAIDANVSTIRQKNERRTWQFMLQRARDNVLYCQIYTLHMKKLYLDNTMKSHLNKVETDYSFEEIKILRENVFKKLSEADAELQSRSPSPESPTPKEETGNQEGKSLLQSWFPGWGGWYGAQQSKQSEPETSTETVDTEETGDDEGLEPKISKSELEEELSHVMEDVMGDSEEDKSVLTRDAVFAKLIFHLDTGSFQVQGTKTNPDTGDTESYSILELECTSINMLFESRPRTKGLTFGLNVGELVLLDKLTENTLFPCLVASKSKDKFGSKLPSGGLGFQKTLRISTVAEDSEFKLFELLYEKNPLGNAANYRFVVVTKPLDIVYNMTAFQKVRKIFSTRNIYASRKSEVSIAAAARRQYETLKRQTKAEFKHSLTQLLEGSDRVGGKRWDVRLDISTPQIIIPESFSSESTRIVVMDLGHLKCQNTQPVNLANSTNDGNNEDEFLTPLSTPPSEVDEVASPTSDKPDLTLDLSEAQVYNKLYDQYTLELTDLQVMVGRMSDNWRNIHHRSSTPLHLVDRFSISLQLERRLIYTTDPQWPTLIVSATLPSLTVHVNEHKIQTINNCIQSLSAREKEDTLAGSKTSSFSQQSLHDSPSSGTLDDLEDAGDQTPESEEAVADQHLRELLEESQLLRMQFSINKVSLEIHSRDRAVAELQVAGVQTDLTKRPYDMALKFTVHSLLVVDALQTYGQDFELLAASHKNITLDSTSGSIRDSATTSPLMMSPGYPPGSPTEQVPATSQGALDVVSKAFQALISKGYSAPLSDQAEKQEEIPVHMPAHQSEALISLEFERINANSPSNISSDGPLNIANFTFNNLDLIANQETLVEIVSFVKRTLPVLKPSKTPSTGVKDLTALSKSTLDLRTETEPVERARLEVTAEFNRLSVLLMRLDDSQGVKVARKVATATVSAARLQASIDSELSMSGSLGGFHVFDITPEVRRHQRVFSVGHDHSHPHLPRPMFTPADMYKTANESMFMDDSAETKAFVFSFSKPLKKYGFERSDFADREQEKEVNDCIKVSIKMASLCYTHSPWTLVELSHCVSEFKDYRGSVASSLKNVASEVAKGMVAKRQDLGHNSNFGSTTSLDMFPSLRNFRGNRTLSECEMDNMETTGYQEPEIETNLRIILDASLDSPVIMVPKNASSADVLVAHLGQISLRNREFENTDEPGATGETSESTGAKESHLENRQKPDSILMEVKDMNLYSINLDNLDADGVNATPVTDSFKDSVKKDFPDKTQQGTPIMYNTTIHLTIDHYARQQSVINTQDKQNFQQKEMLDPVSIEELQPLIDMKAKIQTPLKLVLSKKVYEQILQTTDYISSTSEDETETDNPANINSSTQSDNSEATTPTADKRETTGTFESIDSLRQSSTSSQVSTQFIMKKLNFEVPLFSVELGGDFGDGERGVVELKLHRFVLDLIKDNSATSQVNLSLKSLEMEDLLEDPESPHRQIMVSRAPRTEPPGPTKPKMFLSQSCPNNAIVTPVPMMPPSLPSSFIDISSRLNQTSMPPVFSGGGAFKTPNISVGRSKSHEKLGPNTPPPSPDLSRSQSNEDIKDEHLVTISLLLVDKASPEYTEKYNQTKRFIDVDFNCLDTKINQQTWVVLLDFLGLGSKVHDINVMAGKEPTANTKSAEAEHYTPAVVNSEIKLKVKNLSIVLNKPDYPLAQASVSSLSSSVSLRQGNFHIKGELGTIQISDLSPSGQLYRERFITLGQQALQFDFYKYGMPDPWLQKEYDMKLDLQMSSVCYTHTNKFQAEMLAFIQHFLQLQDVLGRMRAASAGKQINEAAFHNPRLLLNIEAGAPIILIPHSSRTADVLVADLGTLTIRNIFKLDGDEGTLSHKKHGGAPGDNTTTPTQDPDTRSPLARTSSQTSGIISMRSAQNKEQSSMPNPLSESLFSELAPQNTSPDPMTESIYGGLDLDLRNEEDVFDPLEVTSNGSSVDPESPRSSSGLNLSHSDGLLSKSGSLGSQQRSSVLDALSPSSDGTVTGDNTVFASTEETVDESGSRRCLLDVMDIQLTDMDLYAAERVDKSQYRSSSLQQDLVFPSCIIQRQGCKLLKEKCVLNLQLERNLESDLSHAVPDIHVQGSLSSVHCCLDIKQYKLIRGLLDHNLGEKFENFKKDLFTHMQDPTIQTVLSGKVWPVISLGIDLNNVSLELLMPRDNDPRGVSLAKLDFVRSRLTYDLFSDQSKETDLVSQEIIASDTRYRDVATNQRLSVFDRILAASGSAGSDSLQLELHFRSSLQGTQFFVIINKMRLLCSFDWLVALKDFIATKPENPFLPDQIMQTEVNEEEGSTQAQTGSGSRPNSRTTSPLTTSGGIITKRGPLAEQTEVPFEFKLNVSKTEFVVVENLASLDTNAVILKCTSVLWYRPKAPDKLLTCNLESLEVFSCSLLAEEETALSIVDPMSVTIELNANPLPSTKYNGLEGLVATKLVEQRQLLLEVTCNTMNLRLSYQDLNMFLAIMDSLPKQALQASQGKSPSTEWPDGLASLMELGYSAEDCQQALLATQGQVDTAAVWLLDSGKPLVKQKTDQLKITTMEINVHTISLCLIDDCLDADVPLIDLDFHSTHLKYEPGLEGKASFQLLAEYYNRAKSGWEPLIEPWRCQAQWKNYAVPDKKLCVEISASDVLNINVTSSLLELYNLTKDKWTQDYYKQHQSGEQSGITGARIRHSFTPYSIRNLTGSLVWFQPVTLSPSVVGTDLPNLAGGKASETYMSTSDWQSVPPNEEVPFYFLRKKKIRHKKSDATRVNQLVVKVDGWQKLAPLSVDKVGLYFRDTLPDTLRPTIIRVNAQQQARVVFDIQPEGTARKVITLRSALMLDNRLDGPVELKMDNPIIPGRYEYITVNAGHQKPVPMTFVASRLWVRPSDWTDSHCDQPINWQHVTRQREISDSIRQCDLAGGEGIYRFCVAVRRENFPEERVREGLHPVPGHTLLLLPPVTVCNLLPLELNFYLKGTPIEGTVKPGRQCQLPAVDLTQNLELGVTIENFPKCRELIIPPGNNTYRMKLTLFDHHDRPLDLTIGIYSRLGGSLKLTISAACWLVNRSGLPLVFRQDGAHLEAAGQFEEHEIARIVSPLLFSFYDRDCPYLCMVRIGRQKHNAEETLPQWCRSFSLEKEANVCQLHVMRRHRNSPDWVYNIGVETKQGKGQFRETAIVTFSPRFNIDNQSGHTLAIAQRHFTNKEALNDPDSHLTALPGCKMPYHWPRQDLDQLLCVKLLDTADRCNWSGGFKIDTDSSFHVNMRDSRKNSILLKVDVLLLGQTYNVVFTDPEETPPPFHLENMSEVPVLYYQTKTQEDRLRAFLQPHTCVPYAWDEPTLDPYLSLCVSNGTTATYNLEQLGEHEQLSYQNFIYITVTPTFEKNGNTFAELQKELVLDCEHDNHVVFRRKEKGKRTQLWRMTGEGMLENEGLSQPLDPRAGSKSRERFVLDIADIALQPGRPVPLALKKADSRRAAKQTWSFKNGMLCCATGNFCVQSIDGANGLQNGAIAMLGPGPMEGVPAPFYMQISSMKLHPGSGMLTVRVIMDGPVRVVQITDCTQRMLVSSHPSGEEDWEVYEETLNHKTNEKRKKSFNKRHLELDVNLKGGLGISVVNSVPEELLYVSLCNITINYRAHPRAVTFEMSVANVQVDNQLFNSSRQVVLFVTPTSKRDEVENTPALLISAHKIPNVSWNAEIFKHLIISMKKMTMQVEEELLWKVIQFSRPRQDDEVKEKLEHNMDDLQSTLSSYTSVKSQRYYFGNLRINSTCLTLSLLTASGGLPADLHLLKRSFMSVTFNFEDAKVDLDKFQKSHLFDTKERYLFEVKGHYVKQLKRQFTKILGSVDFLGNPMGLVNDVAEGLSGLVEDSNVSGFAKGIFHGVSNSTSKVAGSLSEGLSTVHMDSKHNTKRQQIRSNAQSGSGQLISGLRGFGHGMVGGLKSVFKPIEGARQEGVEGFAKGLYTGMTGLVTKPVAGFLDLASGMSGAVRDVSRRSSHMQPSRVRKPRCCHGPGGLLPVFSEQQAHTQSLLYQLNNHMYNERFIAVESVRSQSRDDSLYVLISSNQVFFLRCLRADKDNIIMNIRHASYKRCHSFEKDGRYYVEIVKEEDGGSIPHASNKRPQIRCDKKSVAQKVAQQINYAKYLFDEQKMTLTSLCNLEEEEM